MIKNFVAISVFAGEWEGMWDNLIAEMRLELNDPDEWTIWVDRPMNYNQQQMPWWPYYRLVMINYNRGVENV